MLETPFAPNDEIRLFALDEQPLCPKYGGQT
jgi:hypothetical protein